MKTRLGVERRTIDVRGRKWEYWVAGEGPPIVAFHGAIGGAETMGWFIDAFAARHRILVPSLGEAFDPEEITAAVTGMLDQESMAHCAILGISLGGLVAHAFVGMRPERVQRVVLISSGAPRWSRAAFYSFLQVAARCAPRKLVRSLVRRFLSSQLAPREASGDAPPGLHRALSLRRSRLQTYASTVGCELVLARIRLTSALHWHGRNVHHTINDWRGRILLLVAHDDPIVTPRERERVRRIFAGARIHIFEGGGHLVPLFHADEMSAVISEFLDGGSLPGECLE